MWLIHLALGFKISYYSHGSFKWENALIGSVIKIHSDFYYVKTENDTFECKIREKLKKEDINVFVGDKVKLEEINDDSKQAAISEVIPRKNYIPRPQIANIDQVIVVTSLHQPDLDYVQLNRYLTQAKLYGIAAVICINKFDLKDFKHVKDEIMAIYQPLGYKVVFTSAKTGYGIDELKEILKSSVSVLSGASGVGKSSVLNKIHPDLSLKTKEVSAKTEWGTHTTRHVELLEVEMNNETAKVADTPGFSHLKFDNILPEDMDILFEEIKDLSTDCYYSDCLHMGEDGCNVLSHVDNIASSRYESYKKFTEEAFEYKEKLTSFGHKKEEKYKILDFQGEKKKIIRLGTQKVEKSRKNKKQKLHYISSLNDAYYNDEE